MRKLGFAILLLASPALAACTLAASAPKAAQRDGSTKLASWNLEHLAEANGLGCRPRRDGDYAELRRYVQVLDADVLAFQEVESKAAAERVLDPARYDVVISGRPASSRGGECYGLPGQSIRHQDVGFAIRKGVPWKRNADVVELGLGNPDLRWGVDVTIGDATPLRLLAVHLKSGCNSGRDSKDADCDILFRQMPVVTAWINERVAAGEAYAILGYWNRRIAAPGDPFFAALDRQQPAAADLSLTDEGRSAACKARYPEFIDHIVAGERAAAQVVPGSFAEYTYGVTEDRHPSDHCPISVLMRR